MLPLLPSYWALVRDEADYLIGACGPAAGRYAAVEAEESLSPAWSAFMRRVRTRILREQRKGARQAVDSAMLRPAAARS